MGEKLTVDINDNLALASELWRKSGLVDLYRLRRCVDGLDGRVRDERIYRAVERALTIFDGNRAGEGFVETWQKLSDDQLEFTINGMVRAATEGLPRS